MYEKVTEKLVKALLEKEEGYQCLNSMLNQYICREHQELLPDVEMPVSDMELQCYKESLRLKPLGKKEPAKENKGFFTFMLSGMFMQNKVYYHNIYESYLVLGGLYTRPQDSVSLDTYLELVERDEEELKTLREQEESLKDLTKPDEELVFELDEKPDEELNELERIREMVEEVQNHLSELKNTIQSRTAGFQLYLNITFTLEKDGHHIRFGEMYLSHSEDGEYIVDEEKNIQYCQELASVFTKNADEILYADLNDAESEIDAEFETETPWGDNIFKMNQFQNDMIKLGSWLCLGNGRYILWRDIDNYLMNNRTELLPYADCGTSIDRKVEPHEASFDKENNCLKINLTYSLTRCNYTMDETGKLIHASEPQRVTVDDITANVSCEIMPDGSHIVFDEFYISTEDFIGGVTSLKSYLPNREAVRRILEYKLSDNSEAVKKKLQEEEDIISNALSAYSIKDEENVLINLFRFKKYKALFGGDSDGGISWPFAKETYFNLLIKMNHIARLWQCLQHVGQKLSIPGFEKKVKLYSEAELLYNYDGAEIRKIFEKYELVVIAYCQEKPGKAKENLTSEQANQIAREMEIYESTWKCIVEAAKQPGAASLIIVAEDEVYRNTFRKNREIFDRLCRHHLEIPDLSTEEVYEYCLNAAKDYGFTFSDEAKEKLHEWVLSTYPCSDVKEGEFVAELFHSQIFTSFLCQGQERSILLPDVIPESNKLSDPKEVFKELDKLVGIRQVKEELRRMYDTRTALGAAYNKEPEHMCFVGNPGTGKTTVARMVADLLYDMHLINKNVMVGVKATDLMAAYSGQTAGKTAKIVKEAYGGVLFIDEAYGLANKNKEFAQEALEALIQEMEDTENPERPVVILAGYEEEMHQLMAANSGLESRIRRFIHFEDYSEDELFEILCRMLEKKQFRFDATEKDIKRFHDKGFKLEHLPKQLSGLSDLIKEKKSKEFFGNAREMRTLCDQLIEQWAIEWAKERKNSENAPDKFPAEHPRVIKKAHIDALKAKTQDGIKELIGLKNLKEKLAEFEERVKYGAELRRNGISIPATNMHMLFVGNPGTGKTTVAKRLADKLCQIGLLPTNKCVVVESKDLVRYQDNRTPAQTTEDFVKRARGGILFIDEAYTLVTPEGLKVIEVLLTAMEKYKDDTIFIFAGYPKEMDAFLNTNPGLKSRIANRFEFPDYEPAELIEILYLEMKRTGEKEDTRLRFADDDAAIAKLLDIMEMFCAIPDFGNGRFVETLFRQIIDKRANTRKYKKGDKDDLRTLTIDDIPTVSELLKTSYGEEGISDTEKLKVELISRVAYHELGHAVVSLVTDGDTPIEKISVKGSYGSYGRVTYNLDGENLVTEKTLKNKLASLLGGRNAERVFFGDSSVGCSSDYVHAKDLAKRMIELWAMGELGISNEMDFLREADARATKILYDNRDFVDGVASKLVEMREISGEQIKKLFRVYKAGGMKLLGSELKKIKAADKATVKGIKKNLADKGLL